MWHQWRLRWFRKPEYKHRGFESHLRLQFMKTENEKLLNYHLGMGSEQINADFMQEVERLKKLGRRLSNNEKALLLQKAKPVVYSK